MKITVNGGHMKIHIKIYQLDSKKAPTKAKFAGTSTSLHCLERPATGLSLAPRNLYNLNYETVWRFSNDVTSHQILEEIYARFNRDDRPNAETMHSLSVSDIVRIESEQNGDEIYGLFYCDSIGWLPIGWKESEVPTVRSKTHEV